MALSFFLNHHLILQYFTHMSELIGLVFLDALAVNEVVSFIINVASREQICVSYDSET